MHFLWTQGGIEITLEWIWLRIEKKATENNRNEQG